MEIYTKTELTPEEKIEDSNSEDYMFTNETKVELLNMIKEVFEYSNFTFKDKEMYTEEEIVFNKLTDTKIIIISLQNFLESIFSHNSIMKERIQTIITDTVHEFNSNMEFNGTFFNLGMYENLIDDEFQEIQEREIVLKEELATLES